MKLIRLLAAATTAAILLFAVGAFAAPLISTPPTEERWFGILVDGEQVGFYRQTISPHPDGAGYRIEADGRVRMKVMGFSKESTTREIYHVTPAMALKSFEVTQTIDGVSSRLTGKAIDGGLRVKRESAGKHYERVLKAKGEVIPGPVLNMVPLMRDVTPGKIHRILTFDPEEVKLKEVKVTVAGEEKQQDGSRAIKLNTNLYAFVNTEILVDMRGNTLLESVRDGLVITRMEAPEKVAAYVSSVAMSQKDLIFDFSMVRAAPAIRLPVAKLQGLVVEIDGYLAKIPVVSDGWQEVERSGSQVKIRTGSARSQLAESRKPLQQYIQAQDGVESDAPEIVEKSREVVAGKQGAREQAKALVGWTASWIEDTLEDGGGARESIKKRKGNCQTHARLYTAMARAAGIPTRMVSGLVSQNGSSFIYHSWAESLLDGKWVAVDPTFNQLPADPTHLAFFEGHDSGSLAPIISVIGKITLKIIEEK